MNMKKYELGPKATFFYDPTNKKKILPGKQVEFSPLQLLSKRTQAAISSGHIRLAESKAKDKPKDESIEDLVTRFQQTYQDSSDKDKVIKMFKKEELEKIAKDLGFEVEESDTKATLFESIVAELFETE